ncbi:uncharacterized protein LOC132697663 [Cylas formicarius]|uniref:uncharacterized protein LOC132696857 n=1 Tax=Cylas formicarius TaxID=197179 RepID=UPI0029583EF8|nr:uncharacterized protein LOC132696857 [Cylas formicarius]XP_060519183.1 uncharacterized protein LOC132697663 [Cylas formicarius]
MFGTSKTNRKMELVCFLVFIVLGVRSNPLPEGHPNSGCGKIYSDDEFIITSDNYPGQYPPNQNCFYLLKGDNCTTRFKFEFVHFDIQSSVGCTGERLEIGNQDALCGSKNGTKIYLAENGNLKLKFISQPGSVAGTGFQIFVKRLGCEIEEVSTTTTVSSLITLTRCCNDNNFSSKRFFITSPNFPHSIDAEKDCSYVITKNNENVCRLRIHALFFWLGEPSYNGCPRGYLEIDGKYICGCNADVKLTSNFRFSNHKILNFRVFGSQLNTISGFVLEVFQDECPKRYLPEDGSVSKGYHESRWPNIEQLQLVHEKSDLFSPDTNTHEGLASIFRHVYVFAPKQENDVWLNMEPQKSTYIDTFSINTLLSNVYNYQKCAEWNQEQLIYLSNKFGGSFNSDCKSFNEMSYGKNCVILNSLAGKIANMWPFWGRQNSCYRFQTQPGYCEIKLTFKEFDMPQSSNNCGNGYLSFGNKYRYCGNQLKDTTAILNVQKRPYQEMRFVSNLFCCRKGFSAIYRQIPCQDPYYPITPANPPWNSDGDHTPKSVPNQCEKIIRQESFILSGYDILDSCNYTLKRISNDVCKLELLFEYFDTKCAAEKIVVDGISYCGLLTGQRVLHNFTNDKVIVYQKNNLASLESNRANFRISGIQISNNCEPDFPPPQRIIAANIVQSNKTQQFNYTSSILRGICQVIQSIEETENYPKNLCFILKSLYPAIECKYFDDAGNSFDDGNPPQLKLKLDNGNSLEIRKLDC